MKLTSKEKDIISCIELRAKLEVDQIRKETGYRDHSIRYCLKRLTDREVISVVPVINVLSMGYTMHNIYFSLSSESKNLKNKIVQALQNAPEVLWIAEFGGDYQFVIGICVRHFMRMSSFLQELAERFGNVFFEKSVASQFAAYFMPRRYLTSKKFKTEPLPIFHECERVKVDDLDKKILSALSTQGHVSHRQIALKLGMPLSSFELRIKRLEKEKVIMGYVLGFNASLAGMQDYKFLIYGKGINVQLGRKIFAFAKEHRNVTLFVQTFGAWDFELNVEVQSAEDVVRVRQELYEYCGNDILSVKVLPKFKDLKFLTHPALANDGDVIASSHRKVISYQ